MGNRTTQAILLCLPFYYLTCCLVSVAAGFVTGAVGPSGILPGLVTMVFFGWIFMLAALSGSSTLGDVGEMQMIMIASLAITPVVLWLYFRLWRA